ncbi:MAG: response regulator [Pedobacter sp.]|nr:MAG: response regulator [Pedobacter sp.]
MNPVPFRHLVSEETSFRLSRILIIEDELSTVEVMRSIMKMAGYNFRIEHQTTDMIGLLEDYDPDLVIIDYILPLINGGDLCSEIKNHTYFSKTPVIIYSAYLKVLMSIGTYSCDAFIAKPFDVPELIGTIDRTLYPKPIRQRFLNRKY